MTADPSAGKNVCVTVRQSPVCRALSRVSALVANIRYAEGWVRVPMMRLPLPRFERVERAHRRQVAATERALERMAQAAERRWERVA